MGEDFLRMGPSTWDPEDELRGDRSGQRKEHPGLEKGMWEALG